MKRKTALVRIELLDDNREIIPGDPQSPRGIGVTGLSEYLHVMLEVPQDPDAEPGQGYYLTGLEVLSVEEG